jgi:hypothetical protein
VRSLRFCGVAVALHGTLLWFSTVVEASFPNVFDLFGEVSFWVLAVPALLLTRPFASILWKCGLMSAPGWFAWPTPMGIALVYMIWVAVLFGLAQAVERWSKKNKLLEHRR